MSVNGITSQIRVSGEIETDFLILGGGISGCCLALKLSKIGRVLLVCKESLFESNTRYAQGGIASVLDAADSFASHVQDTMVAGAGLCHQDVVESVISQGPQIIRQLIQWGVEFTQEVPKELHLTREGGHSARRIIHAADATGEALQLALIQKINADKNITVLEQHMAIDLIVSDKVAPNFAENKCLGAYLLNEPQQIIFTTKAKATIVATGGHGKLYLYTSNPDLATGDGVAMAWRAGARIANLEFMQFHPTCLFSNQEKSFLISEALRGEGAILVSKSGKRFMEGIHPLKELAPRDIVARAIDTEMKRTGEAFVYLDISHRGKDFIQSHFPNIFSKCLSLGIDISKQPIPVVPAAHYSCGGIVTDTRGRTNIASLWAIGEVACTGLHGANRLASNSLLEGAVFAEFVAQDISGLWRDVSQNPFPDILPWSLRKACVPEEMIVISQLWDEIRRTMWNYVGIVRSDARLARASARIRRVSEEIEAIYWDVIPNRALLEVRNLAAVAKLTIQSARSRKESRGIHFSLDYPQTDDVYFNKDTVLR